MNVSCSCVLSSVTGKWTFCNIHKYESIQTLRGSYTQQIEESKDMNAYHEVLHFHLRPVIWNLVYPSGQHSLNLISAQSLLFTYLSNPSYVPYQPRARTVLDYLLFEEYCSLRDASSTREPKWTPVQIGMLRPTLAHLKALGWASTWAKYMRVILD